MTLLGVFFAVFLPGMYLGLLALYVAYTYGAMRAPPAYRAGLRDADRATRDARTRGVWRACLPPGAVLHALRVGGRHLLPNPMPLAALEDPVGHFVALRLAPPCVLSAALEIVADVSYPDASRWQDAYLRLDRERSP